jgi:ribosomal protein S18 acetylase RimI-like enzyme
MRVEGRVVAALAYRVEEGVCGIDRLVVDPACFGRGFGSALVASLLHYSHITVSTGTANLPARRLYEKHGFQAIGEREIAPGVTVTQYERHQRSE